MTYERYFEYGSDRVNYLTHISPKHRVVFVEVPKAGCTSVKRALQLSELDGESDLMPTDVHLRATSPLHAPVSNSYSADELFGSNSNYLRIAFVRNPFSRILSCYLDKIVGSTWERERRLPQLGFAPDAEVDFLEFLARVERQNPREMDIHWAPQAHLLGLHEIRYDFVGRFEMFQTDLAKLIDLVGLNVPAGIVEQVPAHATRASERLATAFQDPRAVDLVHNIYRADFDSLGYGESPLFA